VSKKKAKDGREIVQYNERDLNDKKRKERRNVFSSPFLRSDVRGKRGGV
jgi:hypothetical protein